MDLRQLNYFIAVAEEKHIGRAAERLHVSQPPLTRHIQALEAELGATLFRRTPRGMLPTQAGQILLKEALGVRASLAQAAERVRQAAQGRAGRIGVGIYGSSVFGVIAELLAQFTSTHPEVEVVLNHAQTADQVAALRQGRVQIVFERWLPDEPDIVSAPLTREPLFLALSERHPLARREVVDIEALQGETLITGAAPNLIAGALSICRSHGFEPRFAPPVHDVVTATLSVVTGRVLSLVPESMLNVRFPGITYRPLTSRVDASMEVHHYRLKDESSPLLDALLETIEGFVRARNGAPAAPVRPTTWD
ncbi:LysR substrate-binding domain-containing protein [Variovorax rhizosphaerae]|uniref:LysR substrate-binding domain-containing protein n=1 Tax=Variovorax rhizosphaerae TaxID=1836200 RepID=A0ABU8WJV0_9BURK